MLVEKQWGNEEVLYNGPAGYCMKILTMLPGFQSSLHYHRVKSETFLVISGECDFEYDQQMSRMIRGDSLDVPAGIPHRFRAINGPCIVVECSSHHEDSDVIRLEDSRRIE